MEWVQLKVIKHIEIHGRLTTYLPQEWVEVGGQTAREWAAEGTIEPRTRPAFPRRAPGESLELPLSTGVVALQGRELKVRERLGSEYPGLKVVSGVLSIPFERTLLWDPAYNMPAAFVAIGFHLLSQWQIALPLMNYRKLASSFGSQEERDALKEVIHDLRVLVYDPRCIFVRKCSQTKDLIDKWISYKGDSRLGLLKAIYEEKPLVNALPTTWGKRSN